MRLEEYQRLKYYNYIRPLFIKDKCEACGINEKLELHHATSFVSLLSETLDFLKLEYKEDIKMYTEEEIELISFIMLGKQVKIKYITLCKECHDNIHKTEGIDRLLKKRKEKNIKKEDIKEIEKYLDNNIGRRLYMDEQKQLSALIKLAFKPISNKIDYRTKIIKPNRIKDIIENELRLNYIISKPKIEDKIIEGDRKKRKYIEIKKK